MVHMLTGFLFLLVLLSALRYLQHYTLDVRHDNIWIGQHFKQLKPDLLPLNKIERAWLSDVWSLSCFPGISWTGILKLLLETLLVSVLVALDVLLWSALSSVARHARLDYTQTGQHDLRLEVSGAGLVAGLVRGLLAGLSSSSALLSHTSSLACLPLPTAPLTQHVWRIYCGQGLLLLLLLLNSYVARSSRAVCAYYFPDRESSRAVYLHTQVLRERKRLFLSQNLRSRTAQECWLPRWLLTRCPVLANVLPKTCSVCQDSTWRPQASGFMCCPASSCEAVCCASCSSWLAATCWRCPDNLVACGDMLISDAME